MKLLGTFRQGERTQGLTISAVKDAMSNSQNGPYGHSPRQYYVLITGTRSIIVDFDRSQHIDTCFLMSVCTG